jgi:hypothetical protein
MSKTFRARRNKWDDDYDDYDNPRRVKKFRKMREERQESLKNKFNLNEGEDDPEHTIHKS